MDIVSMRAMITVILMFVFLLFYDKRLLRIRIKDVWCFLGTGVCSIVFFNYCYFKAITMTSLSIASILLYTAPIIVMIFSVFLFGETMTGKKLLAILLAFTGCVFVTGILSNAIAISIRGLMTGLGAGFGYALYSIFGRYALMRRYHSFTIILYTFFFATIGTFLFHPMSGALNPVHWDGSLLLFGILLSLITTILPFLLYTFGLSYIESGKASIMASIEPVVATLIGIFLYHEKATLLQSMGVLLVISSIMILNTKERSR